MELFGSSDVLGGAELLPSRSDNTDCHGSLGTLWTWRYVLASAGGLKTTAVPPQGHQVQLGGDFLQLKGCKERKFQRMPGKERQTQHSRHFWRTQLLTQCLLLFIQRDHSLGRPPAPLLGCWTAHPLQF